MTRLFAFCSLISGLFALAIVTGATAQGEQYGCKRTNFEVGRAKAFLIHPPKLPDGGSRPWVWYAPTIGGHPNASNEWVLKRLLEKGFTVAGVNVGESYGSPAGRKVFTDFYDHVVKEHRLDARANLLAQSRGGLMHYNWAVENPEKVRAIVGIYPVCDLRSYPGLKSAAGAYGLTPAELEKQLARHNPIDRLEPLARAKVPVLHVHGDSDKVVSLEANSKALVDRYAALGGPVRLIVVPGKGHAEIAEYFQEPRVVQFFLDAKLPETKERWKRLTVDEATKLLERPNSLRLDVTELSADVAAVLARYKGELRFESLSSLTPDAAAALAKREGQIDLPKLNALSSATAKALAAAKGALHLPGMKELSVEVVEALAPHTGVLELGVTELSEAQAVALAKHVGQLNLRGLKSLTSLPLAERLGQQEWLFLDSVT